MISIPRTTLPFGSSKYQDNNNNNNNAISSQHQQSQHPPRVVSSEVSSTSLLSISPSQQQHQQQELEQQNIDNILLQEILQKPIQKQIIIPNQISMIGLGCSSFSTFFGNHKDYKRKNINNDNSNDNNNNDTLVAEELLTVDTIHRNHPQIIEWIQTIHYAILDANINILDTAPWYGHGISEIVIGYAMEDILIIEPINNEQQIEETLTNNDNNIKRKNINRNEIIINTKIGRYNSNIYQQFDYTYNTTIISIKRSIERMKCQYINVIQLHDPEFVYDINILFQHTIPALLYCQSLGYCHQLGITGYPLEVQYQILQRSMEIYKRNIWDQSLTYGHFNLHNTRLFDYCFINQNQNNIDTATRNNQSNNDDDYVKDNDAAAADDDYQRQQMRIQEGQNNTDNEQKIESFVSFGQYCMDILQMNVIAAAPLSMGLLVPTNQSMNIPSWHPASIELKVACYNASQLFENELSSSVSFSSSNHDSINNEDDNATSSSNAISSSNNNVNHNKNTSTTNSDEINNNDNEQQLDLSSLAILFAISHPNIPCTIIGMKNIEQIKTVQRLVYRMKDIIPQITHRRNMRYNTNSINHVQQVQTQWKNDNNNVAELTHDNILQMILNENEYRILMKIRDQNNGPFASIWKNKIDAWDGIEQVHQFYKKLNDDDDTIQTSTETNSNNNNNIPNWHYKVEEGFIN